MALTTQQLLTYVSEVRKHLTNHILATEELVERTVDILKRQNIKPETTKDALYDYVVLLIAHFPQAYDELLREQSSSYGYKQEFQNMKEVLTRFSELVSTSAERLVCKMDAIQATMSMATMKVPCKRKLKVSSVFDTYDFSLQDREAYYRLPEERRKYFNKISYDEANMWSINMASEVGKTMSPSEILARVNHKKLKLMLPPSHKLVNKPIRRLQTPIPKRRKVLVRRKRVV